MSEIYQQRLSEARNRWAGEYTQFKITSWGELTPAEQADISKLREKEIASLESNEAARKERQVRIEQNKVKQDKERDEREAAARKAAEAELKNSLRSAFLNANKAASEADFERLLPGMLDDHYKREAESKFANQLESSRSKYGVM